MMNSVSLAMAFLLSFSRENSQLTTTVMISMSLAIVFTATMMVRVSLAMISLTVFDTTKRTAQSGGRSFFTMSLLAPLKRGSRNCTTYKG